MCILCVCLCVNEKKMRFFINILAFLCMMQQDFINCENEKTKIEEKWFVQYLDHFNMLDNRTFLMRYFENNEFFIRGGPLLLEIGGERTPDMDSLKSSPSYTLAKKFKGKVVLLEHRYYGESAPFDNFTTETLKYLNVEQTLEDLAYFVKSYKKATRGLKHSKVVVFGCSYSAALATWFRYKFPHLVDAAWASNAPLHAAVDFYEYLEVAASVYYNYSSQCYEALKKGYEETKQLLSTPEGEEKVKSKLESWSCGNVTEMSVQEILGYIRYVLADHNIPSDYGTESCNILQDKSAKLTPFEKLAKLVLSNSPSICYSGDPKYPNDGLAWKYQTCTEFGYMVTTSSRNQLFNDSLNEEEFYQSCIYYFGESFNMDALHRGIDKINRLYGSINLKVTKVLFVHGTHDPWHRLWLYRQTSEEAPVILIPGTSHCADQNLDDEDEQPQLTKAKKTARKIMARWLQ